MSFLKKDKSDNSNRNITSLKVASAVLIMIIMLLVFLYSIAKIAMYTYNKTNGIVLTIYIVSHLFIFLALFRDDVDEHDKEQNIMLTFLLITIGVNMLFYIVTLLWKYL